MSRDVQALFLYIFICSITLSVLALVTEFGVIPIIVWMHNSSVYYLPDLARMYAWCKLILFAAVVGGAGAWLYDRKRIGR